MRFGIAFANIGPCAEPEPACHLARTAEDAGFESIWTVDHVVVPAGYRSTYPYDPTGRLPSSDDSPFPDPLIWLAYIAAQTSRIRLATGILILPERNPVILAKELATLDTLSSGRVTLGVGIGWLQEEYEAVGVPFERRGERMEEYIGAMRALWTQDRPCFDGRFVSFTDAILRPRPAEGPVPVHIGGHSGAAADRAGRIGDGFFPFGVPPDELVRLVGTMRGAAVDAGRDPSAIELTVSSTTLDDGRAVAEARELEALGVDRIVVPAALFRPDLDDSLQRFGERVIGVMCQ